MWYVKQNIIVCMYTDCCSSGLLSDGGVRWCLGGRCSFSFAGWAKAGGFAPPAPADGLPPLFEGFTNLPDCNKIHNILIITSIQLSL